MAMEVCLRRVLFIILFTATAVHMRRHSLLIENDSRKNFALSTFGFLKGGGLMVDILEFSFADPIQETSSLIGFSLEKTGSDGVSSYMEQHTDKCVLRERDNLANQLEMMLFTLKLDQKKIKIERFGRSFSKIEVNNLKLADKAWNAASLLSYVHKMLHKLKIVTTVEKIIDKNILKGIAKNDSTTTLSPPTTSPMTTEIPISELRLNKSGHTYSGTITLLINTENEGLYNLYFHNCQTKQPTKIKMNLRIIEHNENTFLSAGEIPLPTIYGLISVLFFISGFVYIIYLKQHRDWTFKIHYLMAAVVLLKSLSLAFHAMNYFYIGKDGRRMESWAVLFYITHLLKGALMFTCIVLIGTGFFFVKQVLSVKEKRIFMIVIPLQILANVASIMIDSTEEGKAQYKTWNQIFILVDLICCGTVLFPVVWSIRHLQEAAKTDGKAAISLAKLKLFRHFYVMIVCYIYFTRIIVYLIKITVPFRYIWLDALCTELASLLFFIMTGYKFRPAPTNPYLHVPEDDIPDIEMNEISTQSGLTDGLTRVNMKGRKSEDSLTT